MNYTVARQTLQIVGFVLVGAAVLAAQSSSTSQDAVKVQLMASNTPSNALFPRSVEVTPAYAPQAPSASTASQPAASALVTSIGRSALMPSQIAPTTITLASVKEHTSTDKAWFTAGAAAFPATIRTEPTFGLPANQYGAGATAVSFSFGHK